MKRTRRPYQPRWEGGRTVGAGRRDAVGRYEAIAPHVPEGATVVDLGSESGYFSHRLADEKGCRCIAIDPKAEPREGSVIAVREMITLGEFIDLVHEERPDVTLALSILHHLHPWEIWLDALLASADVLFLEVPVPGETLGSAPSDRIRAIHERVTPLGEVVCETGSVYDPALLRPTILVKP